MLTQSKFKKTLKKALADIWEMQKRAKIVDIQVHTTNEVTDFESPWGYRGPRQRTETGFKTIKLEVRIFKQVNRKKNR